MFTIDGLICRTHFTVSALYLLITVKFYYIYTNAYYVLSQRLKSNS